MRYKRPKLRQLKEKAEAGCFDGTAATGKFVLIKKKIKWQIPKLYCADDPSAKPICFSGSGAASGAITCKDGTSLSTWGCKNGVAETGENTQCGAGGDANYYCISGTDATYKYSEDGCASGTGNPGCGLGANHLS